MNGVQAKLNAAYASGGAQMAIMTIQDLLDINIDYYMQINMQGLVDLVDAVGGITVTNDFDFPISISENEPEYTATVEPGTHKINGEQAALAQQSILAICIKGKLSVLHLCRTRGKSA